MNFRIYLSAIVLALALFAVFIFQLPAQFPYACERPGVSQGVMR